MAGVSRLERHFETVKESLPWDQISRGKVIDVGGGSGYMSVSLARLRGASPNLELIVQDSLTMLSSAIQNDFSDLIGRVMFMPHDFFTTQPVSGAPAYLLRYVTHNWNDVECIHIFRALVPALGKSPPGAPLMINDVVLPALGEASRIHDNHMRQVDIMMMLVLGAIQRQKNSSCVALRCKFTIQAIHGKGNVGLIEANLDIDTARHTEGLAVAEASKDASADEQEQGASAVANQQKRTGTRL